MISLPRSNWQDVGYPLHTNTVTDRDVHKEIDGQTNRDAHAHTHITATLMCYLSYNHKSLCKVAVP